MRDQLVDILLIVGGSEVETTCYILIPCTQSCLTLCNPIGCSLPGSSVHRIFQARIQEWVAFPISRDLPDPGIKLASLPCPALAGGFFATSATWEAVVVR